jgi:hypothetical protein
MKLFFAIVLFCVALCASAQVEVLSPLGARDELSNYTPMSTKIGGQTINGLFIYSYTPLSVGPFPNVFFDDFSKDHFQKYPMQPGDPGVTTTTYHALLELNDTPYPDDAIFTTSPSYRINITLLPVLTRDTTFFPPLVLQYNNLQNYPVAYSEIDVYPNYYLIDTLDLNKPAPDTIWINNNLREQFSADVHFTNIDDADFYWIDNTAHWNNTRAINPWSIGVVTFDGVAANGWPYAINTSSSGYADVLTSKPINWDLSDPNPFYFSFAYQLGGFGDAPESNDSLILEFYNITEDQWEYVWSTPGDGTNHSDFSYERMTITAAKYLQDGFQFRFRNFGGLSGDLDNFHIDYVRIEPSEASLTTVQDFAVVYPLTSLLKDYTSVPWEHYRSNPEHINDSVFVTVRNSSAIAGNTSNNGVIRVFDDGSPIQQYTIPGAALATPFDAPPTLNFDAQTTYTSNHDLLSIDPAFQFPTSSSNDTSYCFDYYFTTTIPIFQWTNQNDTVYGEQCFYNYYSYDDGSAEKAYGLNGEQARLAYQFKRINSGSDSLVAVQIHFVPTVFDHSDKLFMLTVWDDNNGQPGSVLYEDDFFTIRSPEYTGVKNQVRNYYFKDTMKVAVNQTFYVGWRQLDPQRLNVGFDMNTNSADKIFFSTDLGATWQNSSLQGSLMIRPVFSTKMDYQLDTPEAVFQEELTLYPNPANDWFNLSYVNDGTVEIIAMNGQTVLRTAWQNQIDVSTLSPGFYMVRANSLDGNFTKTFKIIKQ